MIKFRRALCLLLCLALWPLTAQVEASPAPAPEPAPTLRVLLSRLRLTDRADLTLRGAYTLQTGNGTEMAFPSSSQLTAQARGGQLYLFYEGMSMSAGKSLRFTRHHQDGQDAGGLLFEKNGPLYPGDLTLTLKDGALESVLTLSVEDYLLGVVPYEMNDSFPLEALKAQAVCARTYALSHRDASKPWDVTDTTNDQVFRGVNAKWQNAARAVRETAGVVGMYKGKLATCYYSASNGGQTELVENVWSGRGDWDYYQMTDDPYDLENPESIVRRATLNKKADKLPDAFKTILCNYLAKEMVRLGYEPDPAHFRVDAIESVKLGGAAFKAPSRQVTEMTIRFSWSGKRRLPDNESYGEDYSLLDVFSAVPGASPTPVPTPTPRLNISGPTPEPTIRLSGFLPAPDTAEITLPLFPEVVRALRLSIYGADNELITLTETADAFVLESRRYGHGVGMSQRGAQWMAAQYGKTFDQILAFYYPGMTLAVAPSGALALPTVAPELAATPGPPATPTPRPTLMPVTLPVPEDAYLASVEGIEDASSLNLRAEPSLAAEVLTRLYKHQQLIVLESCDDPAWVRVKTDVIEGYVMLSYLEPLEMLP